MRRKPTYQELANATLAKTQLGVVTQPYVPFNDNALAVKELQAMTDRLALETRVNQNTQAQVFSTAASPGLPAQAVQGMVDHAEMQRRLDASLQAQFNASQTAQSTQQQRNAELVIDAIGRSARDILTPWARCTSHCGAVCPTSSKQLRPWQARPAALPLKSRLLWIECLGRLERPCLLPWRVSHQCHRHHHHPF